MFLVITYISWSCYFMYISSLWFITFCLPYNQILAVVIAVSSYTSLMVLMMLPLINNASSFTWTFTKLDELNQELTEPFDNQFGDTGYLANPKRAKLS